MSDFSVARSVVPEPEHPNDQLAQVCGEVAASFKRAWGRGPARASAYWAGPDILVVLLENGHTEAEKTMRAAGHIEEVLGGRHLLHALIEAELTESVERIVGRQVETMLSGTRIDPDLSAEIFVLSRGAGAEATRPHALPELSD
jgi:uncharacterized protein YbcI